MRASIRPRRWAVFISGRGSNLQALLDQSALQEIRWVLSSKESAPGLLRAKRAGVPSAVLPKKIDWDGLDLELRKRGITDLFLAGFMKLAPASFVEKWEGRILNVHPSLLPSYPGLQAFEKSYEERQEMGVTVHIVTSEMDAGPRLVQKCFMKAKEQERVCLRDASYLLSQTEQRLVREVSVRWR